MTQLQEPSSLGRIVDLVRDLRQRCPWDAGQTPHSLRPYLVEEALEVDHAIGVGDLDRLKDELGDLMLHVAFQIVLAEEDGRFGAEDLTRQVEEKMWRRHPHLFPGGEGAEGGGRDGGATGRRRDATTAGRDDGQRWETAKLAERDPARASVLDGLPPTLPALIMAFRLQERAAGVGFDWPDAKGPTEKVYEELTELQRELERDPSSDAAVHEVGDLLFAVVNLARKLGHDPRAALERSNAKFERRFRAVEALAEERGLVLGQASLEELDALWEETK